MPHLIWPLPLPNLPPLFSDETLYSWSGFVHASNANSDVRETSRQLFGSPHAALLHDFPAHLSALDERLENLLGQPRDLALCHTLLGYFLPAMSLTVSSQILAGVLEGAESHLKFKLGIAASRVGGHHPLKGCMQCFAEDERTRGRAYWRVQHQFPSTLVCTRHRCPLVIAWDPITPVHRRGWILPHMGLNRRWIEISQVTHTQLDGLVRLADFSEQWAALQPSSLGQRTLALTYQQALRARGFVTETGSLRLSDLNCCADARAHSPSKPWLVPVSQELDFWRVKLRLHKCPSCQALWVVRSEIQGHQDWGEECKQIKSTEEFEAMVVAQQQVKDQEWAKLKKEYEESGKIWRW